MLLGFGDMQSLCCFACRLCECSLSHGLQLSLLCTEAWACYGPLCYFWKPNWLEATALPDCVALRVSSQYCSSDACQLQVQKQ